MRQVRRPLKGSHLEETLFPGNALTEERRTRRLARRGQRQALTLTQAVESYQARYGMFLDGWFQENVSAGQSAVLLNRWTTGATFLRTVTFARPGYLTWLQARLSAAASAGNCTVEVYVAGVASGLSVTLVGADGAQIEEIVGLSDYPFESLEEIDLRVTTDGSFAPTTADLTCRIGLRLI